MGIDMIKKEFITHSRKPFFQIALNYIETGNKVLDIGPGFGEFSEFCQRDDFYLLEGNSKTVELLRAKYNYVYEGVLPFVPFESAFFDIIHCSHVIEHLDPQQLYDSLTNINKVLKVGGYLVISTPLLWSGFYDDLSHIRPYSPFVIEKYLTGNFPNSLTRKLISSDFSVEQLEYRYMESSKEELLFNRDNNFLIRLMHSVLYRLRKLGFENLKKTGYTVVLRKNG